MEESALGAERKSLVACLVGYQAVANEKDYQERRCGSDQILDLNSECVVF